MGQYLQLALVQFGNGEHMKTFLLIKQQDNGCDYTIGCGVTVSLFKAESMEAAKKKLINLDDNWKKECQNNDNSIDFLLHEGLISYVNEESDFCCTEIELYEVSDSFNMIPLLKEKTAEIEAYQKQLEEEEITAHDIKEFERLKNKLKR